MSRTAIDDPPAPTAHLLAGVGEMLADRSRVRRINLAEEQKCVLYRPCHHSVRLPAKPIHADWVQNLNGKAVATMVSLPAIQIMPS